MYQLGRYYFLRTPVPFISRWVEMRDFEQPGDYNEGRFSLAHLFEFTPQDDVYLIHRDHLVPLFTETELEVFLEDYGVIVEEYFLSLSHGGRYTLLNHCNPSVGVKHSDFVSNLLDDRLFTPQAQFEIIANVFNDKANRYITTL